MLSEVLKQLQFQYVPDKLEELDDEDFDYNEETEWQHYLRASIECIMRVADVFPNDVLRIIVSYALSFCSDVISKPTNGRWR